MLLSKVFSDYENINDVCPQLTVPLIKKCKAVGIQTILDFVLYDVEELAKKISIPYKDISFIHSFLLAEYSAFPQRGDSFYGIQIQTVFFLGTGCASLDKFLAGGLYSGEITEIHGPSGAGKTQFCFTIASRFLAQRSCVLYIDTSCNFSVKRMKEILCCNLGVEEVLSDEPIKAMLQNLEVVNIFDVYELFEVLYTINASMTENPGHFYQNLKLIIIDSFSHILAPCLACSVLDGTGLMMNIAQKLKCMSQKKNICVLVCNNAIRGEDMAVKETLGSTWSHVPSVTLSISKTGEKQDFWKITRVKSCRSETFGDINVTISAAGIKV